MSYFLVCVILKYAVCLLYVSHPGTQSVVKESCSGTECRTTVEKTESSYLYNDSGKVGKISSGHFARLLYLLKLLTNNTIQKHSLCINVFNKQHSTTSIFFYFSFNLIFFISWAFYSSALDSWCSVVRLSIDRASLSQNDSTEQSPVTAPVHLNRVDIVAALGS